MTRRTYTAILLITLAGLAGRAHGLEVEEPCTLNENESPSANFVRCSTASINKAAQTVITQASGEVLAQASNADAAEASGSRVTDSLLDLLPLLQGAITPGNTSGDSGPVVLNFNSPPIFRGKTSLQATLSEPKFYSPLEKMFTDAGRDGETKGLLDRAGGFGDTTYSLGWSPVRPAGNWSTGRQLFGREPKTYLPLVNEYMNEVVLPEYTAQIVGLLASANESLRSPATMLATQLGSEFDTVTNQLTFAQLRERARTVPTLDLAKANTLIDRWEDSKTDVATAQTIASDLGDILGLPPVDVRRIKEDGRLREEARSRMVARALGLIDQIARAVTDLSAIERDAQGTLNERDQLDDRFAALISNQPELQVRATYRDADRAIGPPDYAFSITYAAGSLNFNRLLDDYRTLIEQRPDTSEEITAEERKALKKQAFEDLTNQAINRDLWRMTYALTYRNIDDYDETFEGALDGEVQKPAVHLVVPGVEEWQLRLTYSQLAGPELFAADARPRLAFSLEGTWVQEDGDVPKATRRQDRLLGRITYTVPTTDNLTFPVSIVFANHPEFLSEDKDLRNQLSAHVGLSYKLPRPGSVPKPPA